MVLCYTMIVLKLYCSASPGERGGKPPQQVHTEYNYDDVDCDDQDKKGYGNWCQECTKHEVIVFLYFQSRAKRKVVKLVIVVIAAFFLCWSRLLIIIILLIIILRIRIFLLVLIFITILMVFTQVSASDPHVLRNLLHRIKGLDRTQNPIFATNRA